MTDREDWQYLIDADCRKSLPTKGAMQEALARAAAALDAAEAQLVAVAALAEHPAAARTGEPIGVVLPSDLRAVLTDPAAALAVVRAEALREAADELAPTDASAWWVPARWLNARADRIEADQ